MNINKDKQQKLEKEAEIIEQIVQDIVSQYTNELDTYIDKVKNVLDKDTTGLSDHDLNQIMIKLCSYMYFIGTKQELLGIKQDIAEALKEERYNFYFINSSGTVANKTSEANNSIKEEEMIRVIYDRAYKIMKNKYSTIDKWIDAIKKILTMRIKYAELGLKIE